MSVQKAFVAAHIFDGENMHADCALLVGEGKAAGICKISELPEGTQPIETNSYLMAPGYVDLQVNGGGGVLLNNEPTLDGIKAICAAHTKLGTTALFPTLITDQPEITRAAIAAAIKAAEQNVDGFAGLHLEGPHISFARKGAHDAKLIRPMTDKDIADLLEARRHLPALMTTLAPEHTTPEQVKALVDADILVSLGHSEADYETIIAFADAGAKMFTHLFNAMPPLINREPGMVGAALDLADMSASIIGDGHHIHVANFNTAFRAKHGAGKLFLVSDSMSCVGTNVSEFVLNGRKIIRSNGKLTLADGTLAGADIDLAKSVKWVISQAKIAVPNALQMGAYHAAKTANLADRGTLKAGARADFVMLNNAFDVENTFIAGDQI